MKNDSLLLFVKSNRWRNDSLNAFGFFGSQPVLRKKNIPISFLIKNDGSLLRKFKGKSNGKEYTLVEILVKDSILGSPDQNNK